MKPSLVKLQKFFKLEAERGYDNRAVLGGLSRMLEPWEAEARLDDLPEELISAVLSRLRDYNRLSPASREEALQGLWRRIQTESDAQPLPKAAPENDQVPVKQTVQQAEQPESAEAVVEIDVTVEAEVERPEPEASTQPVSDTKDKEPEKSTPAALNAPVTVLPGVGPGHGQTLNRLGLET